MTDSFQELYFHADEEKKTAKYVVLKCCTISKQIEGYRSLSICLRSIEKRRVPIFLQVFCDESLSIWKVHPLPNVLNFEKLGMPIAYT